MKSQDLILTVTLIIESVEKTMLAMGREGRQATRPRESSTQLERERIKDCKTTMKVELRFKGCNSRPGGERLGPGEGEHPPQHQIEQQDQLDGRLHGPAHRLDLMGPPLCPLEGGMIGNY